MALAAWPVVHQLARQAQCGTAANRCRSARTRQRRVRAVDPCCRSASRASARCRSLLQSFLFPETHDTGQTNSTIYSANLAGSLFSLPAGDVGIAVGIEHRREEGTFVPDPLAVNGDYTGLPATPTNGRYDLDEAYVEIEVPLLKEVPFAHELSINVASRYSDFSNFGDTTNNKFGLKWRPIEDLLIRGTYADGFRAPTIVTSMPASTARSPSTSILRFDRSSNVAGTAPVPRPVFRATMCSSARVSSVQRSVPDPVPVHFGELEPGSDPGYGDHRDPRLRLQPELPRRLRHRPRLVEGPHREPHRGRHLPERAGRLLQAEHRLALLHHRA